MVTGQDQRQVRRGSLHLRHQPLSLGVVKVAVGDHIVVHPNDRHERRLQREVHVRLSHRQPPDIPSVRAHLGRRGAKVRHERSQRRRARIRRRAVVIAGHGDDRRRVVRVRLVELGVVLAGLAVVVDDVAEDVEEPGRVVRAVGVVGHGSGNGQLVLRAFDSTDVTDYVERQMISVANLDNLVRRKDRFQRHPVRRLPSRIRKRLGVPR